MVKTVRSRGITYLSLFVNYLAMFAALLNSEDPSELLTQGSSRLFYADNRAAVPLANTPPSDDMTDPPLTFPPLDSDTWTEAEIAQLDENERQWAELRRLSAGVTITEEDLEAEMDEPAQHLNHLNSSNVSEDQNASRWGQQSTPALAALSNPNTVRTTNNGVKLFHDWQLSKYQDSRDVADLPEATLITRLEMFALQVVKKQTIQQLASHQSGDLYKTKSYTAIFHSVQRHLLARWQLVFRAGGQVPYEQPEIFNKKKAKMESVAGQYGQLPEKGHEVWQGWC